MLAFVDIDLAVVALLQSEESFRNRDGDNGQEEMLLQSAPSNCYVNVNNRQGCDRYKDFGSPNPIQNQIWLVLLILTDTKIRYHYGKMANSVSPNQIQIQIRLVLLVRPDTCDDTSQP